jgi:DNA polymerase-3 subunit gamma/tau
VSKALYRKYRSKSLGEVIGQNHVTDILSRAIKNNRVSHAYLLTGPRGVGKTSIARILAHNINGLAYDDETTHLDIIEIDAASNNGVDDVRDLRDKARIAPVSAQKKIYIIDEVHNALLKTLEEPPAHVVFILATTNIEKLPQTIVSRTQQFNFRLITQDDAFKHLKFIAEKENINISDEALKLVAERGNGSFRDSISLLDQLSSLADTKNKITAEMIQLSLGLASAESIDLILKAISSGDLKMAVNKLDEALSNGVSGSVFAGQIMSRLRTAAIEQPDLLPLLNDLIDVSKSPQPEFKLLSVIGLAATQKHKSSPKTAALQISTPEISASVKELRELEKRATKDSSTPEIASTKKTPEESTATIEADQHEASPEQFNWDTLIEHTRKNYVALYSVLSKCTPDLQNTDLTLYTSNTFYKKKLDDTKYSPMLYKSLQEVGVYGLNIHTIPTPPPPKDSQAAAVAAIMGGGEEVSVDI